ncbi:MAG: Spy/CpxP family protein refolding chaperone [Planctomycetes bacterium]|nr:Spy/CpxP family protein refolding chaperone [Planctomycetota bacterium]
MPKSKWIAITLIVALCIGHVAFGEEETEKPAGPKHMMQRHMETLSRHGAMGRRSMCPGCRLMMMRAASPVEPFLENEEELKLTEQQMESLDNMELEFEMAQIDRHAMLQKRIIKLHRVFEAETIDTSMLEEALQETADVGIEMIVAWVEVREQAMDVLTDEQKEIFAGIGETRRAMKKPQRGEIERKGT